MHGGEVDEGYCIVNTEGLENGITASSNKRNLDEELSKEVERITELKDGYSFQFSAKSQSAQKLVDFITKEQKNNPSVVFDLVFQQNEEPLLLQIKGNSAKDFVKSVMPPSLLISKMENKNLDSCSN